MIELLGALLLSHSAVMPNAGSDKRPNLLVLVADDLSREYVAHEKIGPEAFQPPTPHLDKLALRGTRFDNFWVMPLCSPTRCALLTGEYPYRYGIGSPVKANKGDPRHIPDAVRTLPEALREVGYSTAMIGKWHLGAHWGAFDPVVHGMPYAGTTGNTSSYFGGRKNQAYEWAEQRVRYTRYATTETVDDALLAMKVLPEPWFLLVNFHSPHAPLHVPPSSLHTQGSPTDDVGKVMAMIEALDTELGRLLSQVDDDSTLTTFFSDNGADQGLSHLGPAKFSTTEPGVNCTMIMAGSDVPRGARVKDLASVCDLYATFCEIAGTPSAARDSQSFVDPLFGLGPGTRTNMYTEIFGETFDVRAARTDRYKLRVQWIVGFESFHDLAAAPPGQDGPPLNLGALSPEEELILNELRAVVALPPAR